MISIQMKNTYFHNRKEVQSMEILKFLLNNSDAIIISIIGAFIYDKLKITLTGNKSDSNK